MMDNARQDQAQQSFQRDAEARIGMARELSNLPEQEAAAQWGTYRQRLQAAGLGQGLPEQFPGMERLRAVASSDMTTFQRMQLEEKRRQTEAFMGILGGGAPAAPAAGGSGGASVPGPAVAADVPPDMLPHFQAASAQTGIPLPLLLAQAKQESGFNPNAVGRAGEVGVMQILPSTARQPGYGMQGVDPATLRDPAANIAFGAQYLRARAGQASDMTNPQAQAQALRSYNGGGDPNYVQNVARNLPAGTQAPAAPATDQNGLTQQQRALVAAAGPERGIAMMAQFQQQNRMEADRVADRQRQAERDALQNQQQVVNNERADAAAKRAEEAARRQEEAERRRAEQAGIPAGYRRTDNGGLEPIPGGPADKPADAQATEAERKAASYLERMQGAEDMLQGMVRGGYDPGNIRDRVAGSTPLVGNFLTSDRGQQYLNAAAEWARAKLRLESGAVIGDAEAREEARTYFPMPGDSPETIAQKQRLRDTAVSAIRRQAGRAAPQGVQGPTPGSTAEPPARTERPPLSSFGR
jgi:soluble lytic murein transglycosylase-like protein